MPKPTAPPVTTSSSPDKLRGWAPGLIAVGITAVIVVIAVIFSTGDDGKDSVAVTGSSCTASGTGTTDLTKKPVVSVPSTPAPVKTTTIDVVCGTGAEAKEGSNVEVKYLGVLYKDGKEFDSSWSRGQDETLPFTICERIIPGFCIGMTGMKVGGRREVIVTPEDGYGAQGSPPVIPGNATLVFVIDLVKVS
jgi:peptidylprolyl isomerase